MKKGKKISHKIATIKKIIYKIVFLPLLIISILMACISSASFAEGSSADLFLTLSRSPLNIGKTFTLTLKIRPNSNIAITSFETLIEFDLTKFELLKNSSGNIYTKPSGVPSGYEMNANLSGNSISVFCIDNSQNSPIQTKGKDTSLISFNFKVKDSAKIGTASFLIKEFVVNQNTSQGPVEIPTTASSPKTVQVAARLETNAYLSSLTTDIGNLSPVFSKIVTKYRVEVPMEQLSINIAAKAESSLAKVSISGGKALQYGENTITIKVTAQDSDIIKTYTVIVNRPSPEATPTHEPTITIDITPELTAKPTTEPTSSNIESIPPTSISSSSDNSSITANELNKWKNIAYIFIGLFLITLVALIWLFIERSSEYKKVVKIRRI